jgi:hypothetical protein
MEERVAAVTVRIVLPKILPRVAVMVTAPAVAVVAKPLVSIAIHDEFDETQVTFAVISKLVPSEYVPVAVNRCLTPTGMVSAAGVKAMEERVAVFTVRAPLPEILPWVAVMVAAPTVTVVARPVLLMVATDGFDEVQVTCAVISSVVPSEYVPMAMNCRLTPTGMLGAAGVTAMEDRVAAVPVRVVFPEILPWVAVMVAAPTVTVVARPVLLMVATDVLDERQMTCVVISRLVPSEYVPLAVNCWLTPKGVFGLVGVKAMDDSAGTTERVAVPVACPEEM